MCNSSTKCDRCSYPYAFIEGKCSSLGDGSSGAMKNGSKDVVRCPSGCLSCTIDDRNNIFCSEVVEGFSILDGLISKCSISCLTCSSSDQNTCASCFLGFVLVNGQCQKCAGDNAMECLQSDPRFSVKCNSGYTTASSLTKGQCKPCGTKCTKCDKNGENKCDEGNCELGTYFDSTLNICSSCLNNCPLCESSDPSKCKGCGRGRYMQNGSCFACA